MSRDCRCGVLGREAAEKLQALAVEEGFDLVKVYQISHIGGHKVRLHNAKANAEPSPLPSSVSTYSQTFHDLLESEEE